MNLDSTTSADKLIRESAALSTLRRLLHWELTLSLTELRVKTACGAI